MATILEIRESLKGIYSKYDVYIIPVLKFILALVSLLLINSRLGFMSKLQNPAIVIVAALVCSFLPANVIVILSALFCILHVYALSLECAVVILVLFLLMFLLYFRFASSDYLAVLLTPVGFMLNIPYVVPLACGLVGTPLSAVSSGCGVVVYFALEYVRVNSSVLGSLEADSTVSKFKYVVDNLLANKGMMVMVVAFAVTVIVVYMIKRLSIDNSWSIAVVSGAVINMMIVLVSVMTAKVDLSVVSVLLGSIASLIIAIILQFFVFSVDYTRTEHLQFEDDEYYYYVKAVPKMTVAVSEKRVKHISAAKNQPASNRTALRGADERARAVMNSGYRTTTPSAISRNGATGVPDREAVQSSRMNAAGSRINNMPPVRDASANRPPVPSRTGATTRRIPNPDMPNDIRYGQSGAGTQNRYR